MTRVLATGVFDHIHPGHLYFLRKAKEFGELVVVVTNDENAKHKGIHNNQETRANSVMATKFPDKAVIGQEDRDYWRTINEIEPDIIVFGYDQEIPFSKKELKELKKRGIKIERIGKIGEYSSTKIREELG